MAFYYENQGRNSYLVYEFSESDKIDSVGLGMITNNSIPYISNAIFSQSDESKFVKYNVTSKVTVKQFFSGVINKKMFLAVSRGIANAIASLEDYMINPDTVIVDFEYTFINVSTLQVNVICLPVCEPEKTDLRQFFKNVVYNTQFDQSEDNTYLTKIMFYLNSSAEFSISEFAELLNNIDNNAAVNTQQTAQNSNNFNNAPQNDNYSQFNAMNNQQFNDPNANNQNYANVNSNSFVNNNYQNNNYPNNNYSNNNYSNNNYQNNDAQAPNGNYGNQGGYPNQNPNPRPNQNPNARAPQVPSQQPSVPQRNGQFGTAGGVQIPGSGNNVPVPPSNNESDAEKKKGFLKRLGGKKEEKVKEKDKKAKKEPAKKETKAKSSNPGFAIPGQDSIKPVQQPQKTPNIPPQQNPNFSAPQRGYQQQGQAPQQGYRQNPAASQQKPIQPPAASAPGYPQNQPVYTQQNQQNQQRVPVQNTNQQNPAMAQQNAHQQNGYQPVPRRQPVYQAGASFGETTVLGGMAAGETTVLSADALNNSRPQPFLVRVKNDERVSVDKPVFRIGKERSYVDYFIADNTAISRSHANIITREDKFYIVDTNSTNHTFVDGKMAPSNTEVEITHGTRIRLANEDFEFKVF